MATEQRLDLSGIKQQFPALARLGSDGLPFVHTDAPGGTQLPERVINAIAGHLRSGTANASLNGHFTTCTETTELLQKARSAMGLFLNCNANSIVFGANMTSLTFAFSRAISQEWTPDSVIVTTAIDHDANIASWLLAARDKGCQIRTIPVDEQGQLVLTDLEQLITDNTALVAFSMASNATGTLTDVDRIISRAKQVGALTYLDAVHFAAHRLIDVQQLDCDFLVCSPYKFFGPHSGALYGKPALLASLTPYKVRPASDQSPSRWETGTQNFESMAGIISCIDYLASLSSERVSRDAIENSMALIQSHEEALTKQFLDALTAIPSFSLYGSTEAHSRTSTFALTHHQHSPASVAQRLGEQSIFSWSGHFYAQELVNSLKLTNKGGLVRIGFVHYHDEQDVERVMNALKGIA